MCSCTNDTLCILEKPILLFQLLNIISIRHRKPYIWIISEKIALSFGIVTIKIVQSCCSKNSFEGFFPLLSFLAFLLLSSATALLTGADTNLTRVFFCY